MHACMHLSRGTKAALPRQQRATRTSVISHSARQNLSSRASITHGAFAEGAFRYVDLGHYTEVPRNGQQCVAKRFKTGAVFEAWYFDMDIKAVDKAQEIIGKFNSQGFIGCPIYLNHPKVWTFLPGSAWAGQKCFVEPYIENFQKFNTNSGMAFENGVENGWPELMQALSHYSYHATGGSYVLCDLQGGLLDRGEKGAVLTDPVILSRDREFGVTDLGAEGISTFFARHRCNGFCRDHWPRPRSQTVYFDASAGTTMIGFRS